MKTQNIHIKRAVQNPLLAILTLFILFTVLVYFFVSDLYKNYRTVYSQSIPQTAQIMTIFDAFQREYTSVYQVLNNNPHSVLLPELISIKENIEVLERKTQDFGKNSIYHTEIKKIIPQLTEFKEILLAIGEYLKLSSSLAEQRLEHLKQLRYLSHRLSQHHFVLKEDIALANVLHNTIMNLMVLCGEIPSAYSRKIQTVILENLSEIDTISQSQNQALNKIKTTLYTFCKGENTTYGLFLDFTDIQKERVSLLIYLDVLHKEIEKLSYNIFHVLDEFVVQEKGVLDEHIRYLFAFVLISFVLLLCLFYFSYSFLNKSIVKPLMSLNRFVKTKKEEITEHIKAEPPLASPKTSYKDSDYSQGALEVQEITKVVLDFIREIENKERKLLDSHDNLELEVKERTMEISSLFNKIVSLQEDERFKLAAELHDDIGASLGIIKFSIERALKLLHSSHMGQAEESLDESIQIVKSIARQLRRIQTDLRPPHLDVGLLKTLEWYVDDYRIAHPHIHITADFFFDELMLPPSLHIAIFRIIQETMNNISKHSQADTIFIQVLHEDDFRIIISDNGLGFSMEEYTAKASKKNFGLKNIQERVTISGGILKIESNKDKGTVITAVWQKYSAR